VVSGGTRDAIVETAKKEKADVIVVGSRGTESAQFLMVLFDWPTHPAYPQHRVRDTVSTPLRFGERLPPCPVLVARPKVGWRHSPTTCEN